MATKSTADETFAPAPRKSSTELAVDERGTVVDMYEHVTRAELDRPMTYEEVIAASGLSEAELTFLGSVWRVVSDKSELINRPFIVRHVKFKFGGEFGGAYVVLYAIMKDTNEMVIITDGSTGIYQQLDTVTADGVTEINRPFIVPNGLRSSSYELDSTGHAAKLDSEGKSIDGTGRMATTFYLA